MKQKSIFFLQVYPHTPPVYKTCVFTHAVIKFNECKLGSGISNNKNYIMHLHTQKKEEAVSTATVWITKNIYKVLKGWYNCDVMWLKVLGSLYKSGYDSEIRFKCIYLNSSTTESSISFALLNKGLKAQ